MWSSASALFLLAQTGVAQGNQPAFASGPLSVGIVILATALLPLAFMTLTAFIKISTVLQIVKSAIGADSVPSNLVITALATALTVVAMAPVGSTIAERAGPILAETEMPGAAQVTALVQATLGPLRAFLKANGSKSEQERFHRIVSAQRPKGDSGTVARDDLAVVIPAFVVSQLIEAFALGFAVFLPFLVIDLVVSNVLLGLGMQSVNPTHISLPFKLLLFVAVDGWGLLAEALVSGYRTG